ncbi:MAG: hypothetical protein ABIP75_19160 [Pyrinomonadaceae bacterium]
MNTTFPNIFRRQLDLALIFVSLVLAISGIGCRTAAQRDAENLARDDAAARSELQRMKATLLQGQNIAPDDLTRLKKLHEKYPAAADVRQVLQQALQLRRDWEGLAQLLQEIPADERTRPDQESLGKVYLKLGRFAEAAKILGPLANAAPAEVELNSLAGQAWFYTGDHDRAAVALDRVWTGILSAKLLDAVVTRGLIFFYRGENPRAVETIQIALEMDADSVAANNAIARVYAAMGDQQQALIHQQRAEQGHARQTAQEAQSMRLVGLSYDLKAAFDERRFSDCIRISQEMLPMTELHQQALIYQYQAQCYQGMGQTDAAQRAQAEAAKSR